MTAHAVLLALVVAGFVAALRYNWLRVFIVTMLCLIGFTGVHATRMGPVIVNPGVALYAAVIPALIAIYLRDGQRRAWRAVQVAVYADLLLIALSTAIHNLEPAAPGPMSDAIVRVTAWPAQVAVASILAFIAAAATAIAIMRRAEDWSPAWAVVVAIVVAQLVDSLIFFPVAMAELPGVVVGVIALNGWLIKSIVGIALMPLLLLLERSGRVARWTE